MLVVFYVCLIHFKAELMVTSLQKVMFHRINTKHDYLSTTNGLEAKRTRAILHSNFSLGRNAPKFWQDRILSQPSVSCACIRWSWMSEHIFQRQKAQGQSWLCCNSALKWMAFKLCFGGKSIVHRKIWACRERPQKKRIENCRAIVLPRIIVNN